MGIFIMYFIREDDGTIISDGFTGVNKFIITIRYMGCLWSIFGNYVQANAKQQNGKQTGRDNFVGANHEHNAKDG